MAAETSVVIGYATRVLFWLCCWYIVGNAIAQSVTDKAYGLAIAEFVAFPLTFLVYPFAASAGHLAWPLADGTTLIPALVIALISYPISTVVGGLDPVER